MLVVSARHRDLVPREEDLGVFGRVGAGEQHEPAQHPSEHDRGESEATGAIMLIGELPWPPHLGDEGAGQRRDTVLGTHTPSCRPLAEFRCRAIELAREKTKPVLELAKELRISESCLRNWMAQANVDGNGSPTQLASKEKKELVKLRRDKRRLDIECWGP